MTTLASIMTPTLETHTLKSDPPMMSTAERHTCTVCGRAVLWLPYKDPYGSALEETCAAAQQSNKAYAAKRQR